MTVSRNYFFSLLRMLSLFFVMTVSAGRVLTPDDLRELEDVQERFVQEQALKASQAKRALHKAHELTALQKAYTQLFARLDRLVEQERIGRLERDAPVTGEPYWRYVKERCRDADFTIQAHRQMRYGFLKPKSCKVIDVRKGKGRPFDRPYVEVLVQWSTDDRKKWVPDDYVTTESYCSGAWKELPVKDWCRAEVRAWILSLKGHHSHLEEVADMLYNEVEVRMTGAALLTLTLEDLKTLQGVHNIYQIEHAYDTLLNAIGGLSQRHVRESQEWVPELYVEPCWARYEGKLYAALVWAIHGEGSYRVRYVPDDCPLTPLDGNSYYGDTAEIKPRSPDVVFKYGRTEG